ncbi:MAG: hypothetical protein LBH04_08220 [Tannerellaceae bacterium]|jgi:hypothetical protein|nr:hypothetical protein [Tannerellaceae bacterium]
MTKKLSATTRRDIFPLAEAKFKVWSDHFIEDTVANGYKWNIPGMTEGSGGGGGIGRSIVAPNSVFANLQSLQQDFNTKFEIATNPATRTSPAIVEKNNAMTAYQKALRDFIGSYVARNPAITDGEREALGVPVHKTTHSTIHKPDYIPQGDIISISGSRVEVHYHDLNTDSSAKPYGMLGVVVAYGILGSHPGSPEELSHHELATRTPFTIQFDASNGGRTVYVSLCWQNARGERGPWSPIYSVIIS